MLATQKHAVLRAIGQVLSLALVLTLAGCGEPGPRALLKGERFLEEGRHRKALEQLQTAVRLLPGSAQAWNHLGLAYHGLKQPQQAMDAYRRALNLDHKLAPARYNVGCLLLEQNSANAAVEQLTSYTLLEPKYIHGWLKLASAQIQAGLLPEAEESLAKAFEIQPENPEALNAMGLIQVKRNRPLEGLQYFKQALAEDIKFAPALLNCAVVTHDQLKNPKLALEMYREYLEMEPRQANWQSVATVAQVLEQQLNPVPAKPVQTAANTRNSNPNSAAPPRANPPGPVTTGISTNRLAASNNQPEPAKPNPTPPAAAQNASPPSIASPSTANATTQATTQPPPIAVSEPVRPTPPKTNLIARTAEATSETSTRPNTARTDDTESASATTSKDPVPGRPKPPEPTTTVANAETQTPDSSGASAQLLARRPARPLTQAFDAGPEIPRYSYLRPIPPLPGDREAAEPIFREGLSWHRQGRQAIAVEKYQAATKLDPAFFEAYFNQAVAAAEVASWKHALAAYEMALALNPDSVKAHYNFAMALKRANYPADAVAELKMLLAKHPEEPNAHLALANLYAQQFQQTANAKSHYQKVLDLNPLHPEAPKIRYWLSLHR